MNQFAIKTLAICYLLALAGCASTPDAGYTAYLDAVRLQQQQNALQMASIADASACNGDPTCIVATKGFAALAAQGGGRQQGIQQYQRQPGAAERIALAALGTLPGLGQVFAQIESGRNNVDIARIGADRDIGIAGQWSAAITGIAEPFANVIGGVSSDWAGALGSLPDTTHVGGDLISGTQHLGDATTIGRDAIGGDQHVGDNTARDTIGRDRITDSNIGSDNRIGSPGPYDNDTDNSGQCTGDGCQGLPITEPDPDDPTGPVTGPRPPGG